MKNKSGFTLVELIAVISILAVISIMTFSAVTRTIKTNEEKKITSYEDSIIIAAQSYIEVNSGNYPTLNEDKVGQIKVSSLVSIGYLKSDITNPTQYSLEDTYVLINKSDDNSFSYEVVYDPQDVSDLITD